MAVPHIAVPRPSASTTSFHRWHSKMKRSLFLLIALGLIVAATAQENPKLDLLVSTLGKISAPAAQASILKGMRDSLQGQRGIAEPKGWAEIYPKLKESPDA